MSEKTEEQGSLPIANPFCMGEWVSLSPGGENPPAMIRRSAIVAVQRLQPRSPDDQQAHGVKITIQCGDPNSTVYQVLFHHPAGAAADADALMQACLGPPRQRMVEVQTDDSYPEPRYIAIDTIQSITPHYSEPRVYVYAESQTVGGKPILASYRKTFATMEEREEFLRVCGAKAE